MMVFLIIMFLYISREWVPLSKFDPERGLPMAKSFDQGLKIGMTLAHGNVMTAVNCDNRYYEVFDS